MTYAIIETGGKQLRVEPGRFYDIELLANEPDEKVSIESVLLVEHNGEVTIGQPLVCLLYTSPSPRDMRRSRMPSSA